MKSLWWCDYRKFVRKFSLGCSRHSLLFNSIPNLTPLTVLRIRSFPMYNLHDRKKLVARFFDNVLTFIFLDFHRY